MQIFIVWIILSCTLFADELTYGRFSNNPGNKQQSLTAYDLVKLAAKYNPKMQEIHIRQLNESYHQQTEEKLLMPIVELSTSIQKNENVDSDLPNVQISSSWKNAYGGSLNLGVINGRTFDGSQKWMPTLRYSQPLLRGFGELSNTFGVFQTTQQLKIIDLDAQEAFSELTVELFKLLLDYDISEKKIQYTEKMLKLNQQEIHMRQKKVEAGEAAATSILSMRLNAQKMQLHLADMRKEKINLISKISQLVGIDLYGEKIQPGLPQLNFSVIDTLRKEEIKKLAWRHAYDVKKQEISSLITERELIIAKENLNSQLDIYLQTESWQKKTEIGISFHLPLNDPSTEEKLLQIKTKKRQQQLTQNHFKNQINDRIDRHYDSVVQSEQSVKFSDLSSKESKKVYEIHQKKYKADLVSSLDLEKAFLDWYDAGIVNIEKSNDLTKSKLELLHSIGYLLPLMNINLVADYEPLD